MYDLKKSDAVIVAVKQANNGQQRLAESVDHRAAAEENPEGCLTFRVLPAQRVGIPKPIEASGDQHVEKLARMTH